MLPDQAGCYWSDFQGLECRSCWNLHGSPRHKQLLVTACSGGQVLERLDLDDCLIGHQHLANAAGLPEPSYAWALAASPERMLLLTTQGPAHHVLLCSYLLVLSAP